MLRQDVPTTVGILEIFWHFAYLHAPAGDVGKWSDDEIEAACYWQGEPGKLTSSLVACGFVEECVRSRLVIHDWYEHAPEFIKKRVQRKTMNFAEAQPPEETPDPSRHVQTPSDHATPTNRHRTDLSNREEKPGHFKGGLGVEKSIQDKQKTGLRPASQNPNHRRPQTSCPENLDLEGINRVIDWAKTCPNGPIDRDRLRFAWERFKNWARGKGEEKRDWESAFRNALSAGWPLEGFGVDPTLSREESAAERTKQAARKAVAMLRSPESGQILANQSLAAGATGDLRSKALGD